MPEMLTIGLIVVGLLWTGGFAWAHLRARGKAKASETWPTAMGTIASCTVVEEESTDRDGHSSTWYNPVVVYNYSVSGQSYQSQRLRFGNYRKASRKKAEAMLSPYRAGGSAQVRYNPEAPEECVLETVAPGPLYAIMAVFGLLFVGMGLFFGSMT